jgi:hypothetical protein
MLTGETVDKLRGLIQESGGADKDALLEALEDVARVIGTQALLIRNMGFVIDNANVGYAGIKRAVNDHSLAGLFANLGTPKRNAFSVEQAVQASENLVAKVNEAGDFAEIFKAVADIAKVFI